MNRSVSSVLTSSEGTTALENMTGYDVDVFRVFLKKCPIHYSLQMWTGDLGERENLNNSYWNNVS
jgi:hypothetical protein